VSPIMRSNTDMCCWVFGNEARSSLAATTTVGSVRTRSDEDVADLNGVNKPINH
jgi:hypothetical protein